MGAIVSIDQSQVDEQNTYIIEFWTAGKRFLVARGKLKPLQKLKLKTGQVWYDVRVLRNGIPVVIRNGLYVGKGIHLALQSNNSGQLQLHKIPRNIHTCLNLCLMLRGQEHVNRTCVGIEVDKDIVLQFCGRFENKRVESHRAIGVTQDGVMGYLEDCKAEGVEKVIVLYSGHGSNDGASQYPAFTCKNGDISLLAVHQRCMGIGFEMSIVGADCCNTKSPRNQPNGGPKSRRGIPCSTHPFQATGHLLFASSRIGQPSIGHARRGGLCFRTLFKLYDGNWSSTLKKTKKAVLAKSTRKQEVVWEKQDWEVL